MYTRPVLPNFAARDKITELIDIWCGWRGDKLFPSRAEVELRDIGKFLESAVLYDVEPPDQIIIRYFGGRMMDYVGGDQTGQNFLEFANEEERPLRWGRHAAVVDTPCAAAWTIIDRPVGDNTRLNAIGISLPLGAAGEYDRASQILQVLFPFEGNRHPAYARREVDKIHFPNEFQFLDIGAGVGDKSLET
jgi:hypothetical protein